MFDLTGMTALVTGASGGIGSEIAKSLAAQGAAVALSGTREEVLKDVMSQMAGEGHVAMPCNLSESAEVDALVPDTVAKLGKLDILVNNAGITRDGLAMRMSDEDFSDVIRVNLESAFRLIRAAARPMM
ncbi:MAG: SDR family NAD(P)-dependent oxidoreductase, partial [Parasphingorhabdus sp.]